MSAPLALVVAVAENGCIGNRGGLPWHLPEDLRHFRRVTLGHAVIMGRRTHEAIGKPLSGRRNIVLTHRSGAVLDGCERAASLEAAVAIARHGGDPEPRVIGGALVYKAALPFATRLWLPECTESSRETPSFHPSTCRSGKRFHGSPRPKEAPRFSS